MNSFVLLVSIAFILLLCPKILLSRIASAIPTLLCYVVCYRMKQMVPLSVE